MLALYHSTVLSKFSQMLMHKNKKTYEKPIHFRPIDISHWILPDIVAFIFSLVVSSILKKISKSRKSEDEKLKTIFVDRSSIEHRRRQSSRRMTFAQFEKLKVFGVFSSLASLCVAGSLQPSAINAIYFLTFLASSTWLAFNRELNKMFAIILRCVSIVQLLHIVAFILYQTPWFQEIIDDNSMAFRVSGILKIFSNSDRSQHTLNFNANMNFDVYLNPLALMSSYLIIVSTSNFLLVTRLALSLKLN